jgi:hypothetical protein
MNINVLENFYEDPDLIRSLTNEYPIIGCGTGARSIPLQQINQNFYDKFCDKIFSIHNIPSSGLYITTFFMEHEYHPIEIFNQRFVHIDGKNPDVCYMTMEEYRLVLCGQIFMTPDPDPEAGVKVCSLKPEVKWSEKEIMDNCINNYLDPKDKYNAGLIDLDEYVKQHQSYHNNFDLTCDVKNVYNRMVSWKAGTLHSEPMTEKMQKRLTQYFFVERLRSI